ncbi:C40 family peptidase [Clostridium sp. DJ247]|uniref:C40 family peptidase n=1 Tax=Clostridium sp. DJ247 TaxID=2726188 RepID=UPI0016248EF7|nr:glycoside hydrolase [Clostridium sp. DJ247]
MNKALKKLVAVVALTLTLVTSTSVFAQPSTTNVNDLKQKTENLEMNIEKLDNQIETVMKKIDDNKKQIVKTQNDIKSAEADLEKAKKDIKGQEELFNKRMRVMYISGTSEYINILLDSNGIGDFISRLDNVKRIIEFDKKMTAYYKAKEDDINKKKESLMATNKKLLALKSDNEKKLSDLNKSKEEQKKLLVQAKQQERLYVSRADEAVVNSAVKKVDDIRKAAPKVNLSRGAAPISNGNVIAYASNFLGTPYVWGGTSPSPGFDCSGFTQYVYAHFGVSLGRTTYDQINNGTSVSRDQLQPGDLVFFGTSSNPHHMGIYIGDGAYIHAPRTGDVIKVSPMSRSDYLTARRVK